MVVVQLLSFILCATITVSLSVQAKFLDIHNTNISGLGPQQVFVLPCTTNVTSMGNLLTRSGIIYTHNRWRILNVFIDPVYSKWIRKVLNVFFVNVCIIIKAAPDMSFKFDKTDAAQRTLIIQTVDSYKNILPCVTFHFYPPGVTPSGDYVHVVNKDGCWSYIGKIGGRQACLWFFSKTYNFSLKKLEININLYFFVGDELIDFWRLCKQSVHSTWVWTCLGTGSRASTSW